MTIFIKARHSKSDDQTNIEKYQKILYYIKINNYKVGYCKINEHKAIIFKKMEREG